MGLLECVLLEDRWNNELRFPLQPATYFPQESNFGSQAYTCKSTASPSSPGAYKSSFHLDAFELY